MSATAKEPKPKNKIRRLHDFDAYTQEERDKYVKKSGKQVWQHDLVAILVLRRKYGLPGSKGTFMSNLWQWVKQEHPLLSTFFANPYHPFSGGERIAGEFIALENYVEKGDRNACCALQGRARWSSGVC